MRHHYVKLKNHERFMNAVRMVENRGSPEAVILLLDGDPGSGKSCTVDFYAADVNAFSLEGVPGMNLTYVREWLLDQTGIKERTRFTQEKALIEYFRRARTPIIFDEAHHGLPEKATCIEFLRRICEQAGVLLILVCHTSESHRFLDQNRLSHISTRITARATLRAADEADCAAYIQALCEIKTDAGVARLVHEQTGGRFRLMANALITLELIARKKGVDTLTESDIRGMRLCEDVLQRLTKGAR